MNRSSLQSEGGAFSFDLNRPLYALTTEWGYGLSLGHSRGTSRVYSATDLLSAYQQNMWNLEASITRSFGRAHKTNVTLGYRGLVKRYTAEGAFAVPRSEEAGVVFARWQDYPAHYRRYFDRETYLLPEDYRLGHLLEFELAGAAPVFGFTSLYLEASGRANYRWAIGEGLLDLSASTGVRYQPEGAVSGSPWVNRWVTLGAKATSGTFGPFFVVAEGAITGRDSFQNPTFALLGGATYLRGFPSNYLVGTSSWRSNFEVRTKPLRGSSIAAGAAAYLDLGDAFTSLRDFEVHASAGVGLRFLFPEFNRRVLRVDLATPLETTTVPPAYFILTFGQGF